MDSHLRDIGVSAFPRGWYYFGPMATLSKGPVEIEVGGRRFVGFRTEAGVVGVLAAECCHFGADLTRGCVVGESLRCPYHHWRFGADGRLAELPSGLPHLDAARQRAFATAVRHGNAYFHWGPSYESAPPLPFYEGEDPEDFEAGRVFRYDIASPWYAASMNAFDLRHLSLLHGRELLEPAKFDHPRPDAIRVSMRNAVRAGGAVETLVRHVLGEEVRLEVTVHGGPLLFATAQFAHGTSYMAFSVHPSGDGRSCRAYVHAHTPRVRSRVVPRPVGALAERAALAVRTFLTDAFFRAEAAELRGIRYNERLAIEGDEGVRTFIAWARGMNRGVGPEATRVP